jgi:hypothetical protein
MCPVCGYDLPSIGQYDICPCCGIEFGLHDATIHALRNAWIAGGCQWWSKSDPVPQNWNPYAQLNGLIAAGMA